MLLTRINTTHTANVIRKGANDVVYANISKVSRALNKHHGSIVNVIEERRYFATTACNAVDHW